MVDCISCDEPVDGFWLWRYEGVRLYGDGMLCLVSSCVRELYIAHTMERPLLPLVATCTGSDASPSGPRTPFSFETWSCSSAPRHSGAPAHGACPRPRTRQSQLKFAWTSQKAAHRRPEACSCGWSQTQSSHASSFLVLGRVWARLIVVVTLLP